MRSGVAWLGVAGCVVGGSDDVSDGRSAVVCPGDALTLDEADGPVAYEAHESTWTPAWRGEARTVPVGLWASTPATEGEPARYLGAFADALSLDGAPVTPPPEGCKAPLVVWSHGAQAWQGNATSLLRRLVRQGWVLAAPDHVGNTLVDNVSPKPPDFLLLRAGDVSAAIDAVEDLPSDHPLAGRVDTTRVFVAGHSFGGQTTSLHAGPTFDPEAIDARCAEGGGCSAAVRAAFDTPVDDPRVVAVAPLAGFADDAFVSAEGWARTERPILLMTGSADWDGAPTFARAAGADLRWLELEGGCHESFTDTAVACGTLDKSDAHRVLLPYLLGFAALEVLGLEDGEAAGLLSGATPGDPLVTIRLTDRAAGL